MRGHRRSFAQRARWLAILSVLAAAFVFARGAAAAPARQDAAPTASATPAPPCSECHLDVGNQWELSPHAQAFESETFQAAWSALGQPGECLGCHTTGYQSGSGTFTTGSVHCESCHAPPTAPHPPASLAAAATSEHCGLCHTPTLTEWRLSGHAAEGVGCVDCHNPHSQAPRFATTDELCASCHKEDVANHRDNLHAAKGVGCVDCHALALPPQTAPQDGLVPTGHSFRIGAGTCVACHSDTVLAGQPLPGYEDGPVEVEAASVTPTPTLTPLLDTGARPAEVQAHPSPGVDLFGALLLASVLLGGGAIWIITRVRRPRPATVVEPPPEPAIADAASD